MSAFTKPLLVFQDGSANVLERVPLAFGGSGQKSERWLQDTLFAHPEVLPVKEIDPHIGPLIPVCTEIETGAGQADILFVTPSGQVVLVETKLWRNPEARREVVAQILDYAKQLTSWTYEVLDQKSAIAAGASNGHLLKCLLARYPQADEAAFVDGVRRSLSTGDFLLLIVGDGIRYGAESLVEFLERYGHLRFGLGLVEVAAYDVTDGGILLQPRILAKTEVLQRTLLIGPNGPLAFQQVAEADDSSAPNLAQREWFVSFWSQFLSQLHLDDPASMPTDAARSTNQFFSMPPGGGKSWVSAYISQASRKAGVYLTFAKAYERGMEVYEVLEGDREAIEREIGHRLSWERTGDKFYIGAPNIGFLDLNSPNDRATVIAHLTNLTELMIRTFKPRLQAATREIERSSQR